MGRLGLQAPAAVSVEVRTSSRRVYRLSSDIGVDAVRLVRPAPFEPGEPVKVRFRVPDAASPVVFDARITVLGEEVEDEGKRGGCGLVFLDPPLEARTIVAEYVKQRLGLFTLP